MTVRLYYPNDIKDVTVNCPKCKKPVKLIENYIIINRCCPDPKCGYPAKDPRVQTLS